MAVSPAGGRRMVLINGIHSKSGGGKIHFEEIVPRLCRLADGVTYVAIVRPDQCEKVRSQGCPTLTVSAPQGPLGSFVWDQAVLPLVARRRKADLVFNLASYGPWLLGRRSVLLLRSTSEAGTSASSLFLKIYWPVFDLMTRISVRVAGGGLVVSAAFRDRVADRYGVARASLDVVHHGVGPAFRPEGEPGEDADRPARPYVLGVSDLYPHKNLGTVLEAFARVAASRPGVGLVIVGRDLDPSVASALRRRASAPDLTGRVTFLGWLPTERLPALYRGASASIFLSLAETFGIPQIEALACGTPLVASDLPFGREIAGDAAILVDPRDPAAAAAALGRILDDPGLARELGARGIVRARSFTLDACARRTHEAIVRRLESVAPRVPLS